MYSQEPWSNGDRPGTLTYFRSWHCLPILKPVPVDVGVFLARFKHGTPLWVGTTTNRCPRPRHCGESGHAFQGRAGIYRRGISKCFRPNRRASIDHAPGPVIANVAADVARRMEIPLVEENAIHASTIAIRVPLIGVHKPKSIKIAGHAATTCGMTKANCGVSLRRPNAHQNRNVAVIRRCTRRPLPGQPFGNIEKRRCKDLSSLRRLTGRQQTPERPNEGRGLLLSGGYSSMIPRFTPIETA